MKIATPLKKVTPLFPSNPPLKVEILSSAPPFLKIWLEAQPPPPPPSAEREEVPTMDNRHLEFAERIYFAYGFSLIQSY